MIHTASVLTTENTNPYHNLALEQLLLEAVEPQEVILYLWQNRRTVVIGRNQSAWRECRVSALEADEGFLARRPSGGGAVFHDMGNLNFTFLARNEDYDVARQLSVIVEALRSFDISAQVSGRNDLTADGRKFSGNAFLQKGDRSCHHGTLLVDVDTAQMGKYLNVRADKLQSKGVQSVRARVVNLRELCPEMTIEALRCALTEAFGAVYGCRPKHFDEHRLDACRLDAVQRQFASDDWRLDRGPDCRMELSRRFDWGDLVLHWQIRQGKLSDVSVYSDAMDADFVARLPEELEGCACTPDQLVCRALSIRCDTPLQRQMAEDMLVLLAECQ